MEKEKIWLEMKSVLAEEFGFKDKGTEISPDDDIFKLGLDSFQMVEFAYELESRTGVKISNEDLGKIKKISDLMELISQSGG